MASVNSTIELEEGRNARRSESESPVVAAGDTLPSSPALPPSDPVVATTIQPQVGALETFLDGHIQGLLSLRQSLERPTSVRDDSSTPPPGNSPNIANAGTLLASALIRNLY